jgi:hypothetical protein
MFSCEPLVASAVMLKPLILSLKTSAIAPPTTKNAPPGGAVPMLRKRAARPPSPSEVAPPQATAATHVNTSKKWAIRDIAAPDLRGERSSSYHYRVVIRNKRRENRATKLCSFGGKANHHQLADNHHGASVGKINFLE